MNKQKIGYPSIDKPWRKYYTMIGKVDYRTLELMVSSAL